MTEERSEGSQRIAPARSAALRVLRAVREGEFADRALERHAESLEPEDRRLCQELVYGVLRLRGRLDYILDRLLRDGLVSVGPDVVDALRLGAYQLLELDRVPAYAAVSESVDAARSAGGEPAAAVTNAVLRRIGREGIECVTFPDRRRDPVEHLSRRGSHPRWLVERWLERWDLEDAERLVDYNNRRPSVYLTVIQSTEDAIARLAAAGVSADRVALSPESVRIEAAQVSRALETVDAVVQDPAAALVVRYAALDPGMPVADLCAAPGGKAAVLAGRGHPVRAFDVSAARLVRVREHRVRLGLERLYLARADAACPPLVDSPAVLLDVPCTGTGTLARHPDARWRLGPADLEALVRLQRRWLDAAARVVAPGGYLIYATCSLEAEENEAQTEWFAAEHPDYEIAPPPSRSVDSELLSPSGELMVLPQRHGIDGAYAARFRRERG